MQSLLQGYYVVMAGYGWWSWTRNAEQEEGRIYRWPLRRHLVVVLILLVASALTARFLARETQAAWPLLDSFTTWTSLVATWMVTRSVLENWLYWICADLIMVGLFAQQGYPYTSGLFLAYATVSVLGLRSWLQRYRRQSA
jgi:nicotinamide mononucleotide transporter